MTLFQRTHITNSDWLQFGHPKVMTQWYAAFEYICKKQLGRTVDGRFFPHVTTRTDLFTFIESLLKKEHFIWIDAIVYRFMIYYSSQSTYYMLPLTWDLFVIHIEIQQHFQEIWCFTQQLQWCYTEHDGISNHLHLDCLLNCLFNYRSKKHQSSLSLAFVRGIYCWPVDFSHKGPVMRKVLPFDDVTMD